MVYPALLPTIKANAHTSAASSRLNWRPRRFKWTHPFRQKTKSGFCACAITFQLASTNDALTAKLTKQWHLVGMYDHRTDKWQYFKTHKMAYGVMFAVETVSNVRQVMGFRKGDRSGSGIGFSLFTITHRPPTQRLPGDKTAWSRGPPTIHPPPNSATVRKTRNVTNVQSFPHGVVCMLVRKKLYFLRLKVFRLGGIGRGRRYNENYLKSPHPIHVYH